MAVMSSIERGRVHATMTEIANQAIRTAIFDGDCAAEDEVDYYRGMLVTSPGAAVVGLKRTALGIRFLLGRWERLLRLIHEEGTLYGNDRNEAINYQGARASEPEDLFESEGAYLTYLYCLMCQPAPKDEHFIALGNERWMPAALMDRKAEHWLGKASLCRTLLIELAESELAFLRARELLLRTHHEAPARAGAEVRTQVLRDRLGAQLVRLGETHERQFYRAYNTFMKGRALSAKAGVLPGAPDPMLHAEPEDDTGPVPEVEPVSDVDSAEESRRQRMQAADALAPGRENGIGAAIVRGDRERAAVMAAGPMSAEEIKARRDADEEAEFTALASTPTATLEASAEYL
jgi:hypothetical protein